MRNGFTLLMTLLYITAALAVGIGVASLIGGEIGLSGTARDSQRAFYAADFGAECALYWDLRRGMFVVPTEDNGLEQGYSFQIQCGGNSSTVRHIPLTRQFIFSTISGRCSDVALERLDGGGVKITARGYNICKTTAGRRVERGLQVEY